VRERERERGRFIREKGVLPEGEGLIREKEGPIREREREGGGLLEREWRQAY
jgi:hypothetical protein